MPKTLYEQSHSNVEPQITPDTVAAGGIRGFIRSFRRRPVEAEPVVQQDELRELEDTAAEAENYTLVASLVSDEVLEGIVLEAERALEAPEMQEIAERIAEKDALYEKAQAIDMQLGFSAAKPLFEQAGIVSNYLYSPDVRAGFIKHEEMTGSIAQAQRGRRRVGGESAEAQALFGILADAHRPVADQNAPFANYKDNNESSWQYVEDSAVRDHLASRRFIDTHTFGFDCNSVTIEKTPGKPYEVPLSAVVSAAGFDSWEGRDPRHGKNWSSSYGSGGMKSLAVIKHYAGLETEIPPVNTMHVYIQPDGQIFCDNGSGDSHRIAAAMLRGQDTIQADKLEFVLLKDNLVPSQE